MTNSAKADRGAGDESKLIVTGPICNNGKASGSATQQDAESGLLVPVAYRTAGDGAVYEEGDKTAPLTTGTDKSANVIAIAQNQQGEVRGGVVVNTLGANSNAIGRNTPMVLKPENGVRRLTPRECERLQHLPDDWTRWGRNEKGELVDLSDSARYRLCGNGVTESVVNWIGKRIIKVFKK